MSAVRVFLFLALILCLSQPAMAQTYGFDQTLGTSSPYDYTSAGTAVLTIPSEDVLSAAQPIPFAWSFFGNSKTHYYVSDNGYITFDPSAVTSFPSNTSIPNAGGPNDAIYAFWDDLGVIEGTGSVDEVRTSNYGEAPNRVHVIQWFSVTPAGGTGFVYATIRLYECGDFDVVLNYGNATGMTATIGCENSTGTLGVQVAGSPNIPYPSTVSAPNDDVVYTFYSSAIQYDVAITSLDLGEIVTPGINSITGTLKNLGSVVVTGYDLIYQIDGGAPVVDSQSGLSIDTFGGTHSFTHSTPWNVISGGQSHDVTVWVENINVSHADQRTCNDEFTTTVFTANNTWGFKRVLLETFTGSWCGWCPDGSVVQEQILSNYGPRVMAVEIHDGDAMEFPDGIRSLFGVSAYPNGMVDRALFAGEFDEPHSRGAWQSNVVQQFSAYTPLNVGITSNYIPGTRQVEVTLDAHFIDYGAGDLRFVCMIVEDNIVGSGTGYDQTNYLNGTAGHPYEGAGDPIIGFNHRHVLRDISSAVGNPGVISTPINPGETATESFLFTLPAEVDESQVSIIGFVAKYGVGVGEKTIQNVQQAPLGETREVPLFATTFNSGSTGDWGTTTP